jgi:hypothetical protein
MKKQIRTLVQIAVVYLAISIILDFFLAGYPILTWLGIGFAFLLFGIVIFDVLLELTVRPLPKKSVPRFKRNEDDLMRLDELCKKAIDRNDPAASQLLSERIRSLAFGVAAYHCNTTEPLLREMFLEDPASLQGQVHDQYIVEALTATDYGVTRGDTRKLDDCLTKIEDWSN